MSDRERIEQAEAIIRAFETLTHAMYHGDLEALWPDEAWRLRDEYIATYPGADVKAPPQDHSN